MKSMPEAAAVKSQITGEHVFLMSIPSLESVMEGLKPTENVRLGNCVTNISKHKML